MKIILIAILLCSIFNNGYAQEKNEEVKYSKITQIETSIIYYDIMKQNSPKLYFEKAVNDFMQTLITNFYLFHKLPTDSCLSLGYHNTYLKKKFQDYFLGVDFKEYDKKLLEKLSNSEELIQMRRSDFWETIFKINKEYASLEGFALIENAIRKMHDALELDWNGMIFVGKNVFDKHRTVVEEIFTKMREELNPVYLK